MAVNYKPEGLSVVSPYLVVESVERLFDFLKATFDAVEIERIKRPDGTIAHGEVRIEDAVIMSGQARAGQAPMENMIHVYVKDVDLVFKKAIENGATPVMEPEDQFYGDRSGGVKGPMGNIWWIATHIEDLTSEEIQARAHEMST